MDMDGYQGILIIRLGGPPFRNRPPISIRISDGSLSAHTLRAGGNSNTGLERFLTIILIIQAVIQKEDKPV